MYAQNERTVSYANRYYMFLSLILYKTKPIKSTYMNVSDEYKNNDITKTPRLLT